MHADEAGGARKHCADQKADRGVPESSNQAAEEDDDADDGDGHVLTCQIGLRAFTDRAGDFLHARIALVGREHRFGG